jgi:hypothetical protein
VVEVFGTGSGVAAGGGPNGDAALEPVAARVDPASHEVERIWFRIHFAGGDKAEPVFAPELGKDADFELIDAGRARSEYEELIAEWALSDKAVEGRSLDEQFTFNGEVSSLRMIYIHLIGEYARHCGHADFLREHLDGVTGA